MSINYIVGDATQPRGEGPKILVHVCNDIGGWGRGFVLAISQRWKEPEQRYRAWHRGDGDPAKPMALGEVQFVEVAKSIWVANLIGQRDVRAIKGVPPIRYDAIRMGVQRVAAEARRLGASVHMPRIGCGLAGGSWEKICPIIEKELLERQISVFVYDLGGGS